MFVSLSCYLRTMVSLVFLLFQSLFLSLSFHSWFSLFVLHFMPSRCEKTPDEPLRGICRKDISRELQSSWRDWLARSQKHRQTAGRWVSRGWTGPFMKDASLHIRRIDATWTAVVIPHLYSSQVKARCSCWAKCNKEPWLLRLNPQTWPHQETSLRHLHAPCTWIHGSERYRQK